MRNLIFFVAFLFNVTLNAQENKIIEEKIKVFGNCNDCKLRIENALKIKEVKFARWNKNTKILKIAFDSSKISTDSIMYRIAIAGHDTEKFNAPDSIYAKLPECCLYRNNPHTH